MKNWTVLQDRYLRETLPNRLGELAANLARIRSFSQNDQNCDAVASLIEETILRTVLEECAEKLSTV